MEKLENLNYYLLAKSLREYFGNGLRIYGDNSSNSQKIEFWGYYIEHGKITPFDAKLNLTEQKLYLEVDEGKNQLKMLEQFRIFFKEIMGEHLVTHDVKNRKSAETNIKVIQWNNTTPMVTIGEVYFPIVTNLLTQTITNAIEENYNIKYNISYDSKEVEEYVEKIKRSLDILRGNKNFEIERV